MGLGSDLAKHAEGDVSDEAFLSTALPLPIPVLLLQSPSPLIDQLHRAMHLWNEERRADLVTYLREHELLDHAPFWKLAQALFEVLPRGEEDWKLISALLSERETLRLEARRTAPPTEQTLFDA